MKIKMKVPALIMLMLLGLMACKKDSRVDDAVADVYVKCILIDGQPAYALAHYVLGQSAMSAVTVNGPDVTNGALSTYDNSNTLFYSEPLSNSSYSFTVPTEGTYTYGVKFDDGVEKTYTDQVSEPFLLPPNITSLVKSDDGTKVQLRWDPLTDAEYYRFDVIKNGSTVYSSQLFALVTSDNYIEFPISYISPFSTGTYTFELIAYKYQSLDDGKIESSSSTTADVNL